MSAKKLKQTENKATRRKLALSKETLKDLTDSKGTVKGGFARHVCARPALTWEPVSPLRDLAIQFAREQRIARASKGSVKGGVPESAHRTCSCAGPR
jgi:hypothetical protein